MYFIKLPHNLLDNQAKASLSDRLWRRLVECYLAAGRLDEGGFLPEIDNLAWTLHLDPHDLVADLNALVAKGFLDLRPYPLGPERFFILDFETTQMSQSKAAKAKRAQREKEKVTKKKNNNEEDHNRGEESRLDKRHVLDMSETCLANDEDMSQNRTYTNIEQSFEPLFDLPKENYSEQVAQSLYSWYLHKAEQKKPLTKSSAAALIKEVDSRGEPEVIEAINFSILNNYNTLIFPEQKYKKPDANQGDSKKSRQTQTLSATMRAAENVAAMIERSKGHSDQR